MPRNKLWHLSLLLGGLRGITIIRAGKEIADRRGKALGAISDVNTPITREACEQAESFLQNAVQITFVSGHKTILNCEDFEWNRTPFSRSFRTAKSALEFVTVWERVTDREHNSSYPVPIVAAASGQAPSSKGTTEDDGSTDDDENPEEIQRPPPKRAKKDDAGGIHTNPLDDAILSKKIGIFDVPVIQLVEPDCHTRLIRAIDEQFLAALKAKMLSDPSAPGVPPIAVNCMSVKESCCFETRLKDVYKYEVLGGQHTSTARASLHREHPDQPIFSSILAEIYVGLTDDEALRLSSRHNLNGHFIHKMTHRDYVEACRCKLFAMEKLKQGSNETPQPGAEWKKACSRCILPETMSRSQKDNIFSQAAFSLQSWKLASTIMDKFEKGSLKNQKIAKKHLVSQPDFKQQYFQPIQNLPTTLKHQKVDIAYWYNTAIPTTGIGKGFIDAITGVAIAHFSLDGEIKDDHYNFIGKRHNIFVSEPESCPYVSFFKQIIEAFSFEGQVVFSAMAGKGECAVAALKMKRNAVVVDCDTTHCKSTLAQFCSKIMESTED